jgi:putative transposase
LSWSAYDLRKTWNQAKNTTAPWWAENSKEAYSSGLANLATALGNWHASKTGSTPARQRADSGHVFTRFLSRLAQDHSPPSPSLVGTLGG